MEYDIKFNGSKSQLIVFRCNSQRIVEPHIEINGSKLEVFKSVIHLGHILHENIYHSDVSKCVSDFNRQSNAFLANFKHATSHFRNHLFHKYCSSFYGSQILPMYEGSFNDIFKAWRMALRRVWRVPWRTHCNLLPHLAGVMAPELWFAKRAINFVELALNNSNSYVRYISNMSVYGAYSIMGGNIRWLQYKFDMKNREVNNKWKDLCNSDREVALIRNSVQIIELCGMRDRFKSDFLTREEISIMIDYICTS